MIRLGNQTEKGNSSRLKKKKREREEDKRMNGYSYWSSLPLIQVKTRTERRKEKREEEKKTSNSIIICTYIKEERIWQNRLYLSFFDM